MPREVVEQWLKYLRNEFPTVAFKAVTQNQRQYHGAVDDTLNVTDGSGAHGTGVLMSLLANYSRHMNLRTAIRVGIVGPSTALLLSSFSFASRFFFLIRPSLSLSPCPNPP